MFNLFATKEALYICTEANDITLKQETNISSKCWLCMFQ